MNHLLRVAALLLVIGSAQSALATGPNGVWTWTTVVNQQARTSSLHLKFDSENKTLAGYYSSSQQEPSLPISQGVYKGGDVTLTVLGEHQGQTYTLTFHGTRSGDAIVGTSTLEINGETHVADWSAARSR